VTDKTRSENWGQSIEGIECHMYIIIIYNKGNSDNDDLKQKGITRTSKSWNSGMARSRDLNDTISTSY